jgi:glyoxylase-like metal-dependent hydrolase (beta-lactamase superfamily II)
MRTQITPVAGDVMKVNAFVVHSPRGNTLIDGMLTVTDARKVRSALDASAAELAGVVITQPHPDHYAGLADIVGDHEVPIVATTDVDAVIRRDDQMKETIVGPMMGAEWPDRRVFPNRTVEDGETVSIGGLELRVRSLGPGESFADTIWELDHDTVFVGDVAYSGMHAYLADGQWTKWLDLFDRLERDLSSSATLYVGHGPPGGKELLGAQRQYIETFVESVRRHAAVVASGDHRPVLDERRTIVRSDDLCSSPTSASRRSWRTSPAVEARDEPRASIRWRPSSADHSIRQRVPSGVRRRPPT